MQEIINGLEDIFGSILKIIVMLLIAAFSGVVAYIYKCMTTHKFSVVFFFVNMLVSILIGFLTLTFVEAVYATVPEKLEMFLMGVVGISSNKLFDLLQTQGANVIIKLAKDKLDKK